MVVYDKRSRSYLNPEPCLLPIEPAARREPFLHALPCQLMQPPSIILTQQPILNMTGYDKF